jgi:hypothetical protein
MSATEIADLAQRLADNAYAFCREYLSNGHRHGRYWIVVRLHRRAGSPGEPGKWTDAATGEHGDLLDLIRLSRDFDNMRDVLDEARKFLSLPHPQFEDEASLAAPRGSPESARRLFAMSKPITRTLAETYLRSRSITHLRDLPRLRFHPNCYCRPNDGTTQTWPALIAAVTDLKGTVTGAHRTWLDPSGTRKAPLEEPRKAMGHLLGNAVRFGVARDVLAAGEGIETMLSLRDALPDLPMAAGLSANHLAAILFPPSVRLLYIARDADPAGDRAVAMLTARGDTAGIETRVLVPRLGDFNDDLRSYGVAALRHGLRDQLAAEHAVRFFPERAGTL